MAGGRGADPNPQSHHHKGTGGDPHGSLRQGGRRGGPVSLALNHISQIYHQSRVEERAVLGALLTVARDAQLSVFPQRDATIGAILSLDVKRALARTLS